MRIKMKPETIERRRKERIEAEKIRRADVRQRLKEKAEEYGPGSVFDELYQENLSMY